MDFILMTKKQKKNKLSVCLSRIWRGNVHLNGGKRQSEIIPPYRWLLTARATFLGQSRNGAVVRSLEPLLFAGSCSLWSRFTWNLRFRRWLPVAGATKAPKFWQSCMDSAVNSNRACGTINHKHTLIRVLVIKLSHGKTCYVRRNEKFLDRFMNFDVVCENYFGPTIFEN